MSGVGGGWGRPISANPWPTSIFGTPTPSCSQTCLCNEPKGRPWRVPKAGLDSWAKAGLDSWAKAGRWDPCFHSHRSVDNLRAGKRALAGSQLASGIDPLPLMHDEWRDRRDGDLPHGGEAR